ncbi:hypothetical protein [Thermus scotoductus]|uniref:Uncharacterized protein n=1 Tax=Thermus scotoductus TaxID=37636 RepID=A0A430RTV8_THESC|nr:hypothetical protein [Thermus scotoductus]RTG96796.1 hypothetical protein CSW51_04390 [Thermus scotoductus]RTH23028.1 hypothetical protein CSW38_11745 [Thermus scotoductus]
MNLPGIPDYTYFISQFISGVQGIGLSTWFNVGAQASIFFAFVWAIALFAWGNRMAAQATFIRAMVALLLFNLGTRPEGQALRAALYDGWRAAHQSAVRKGVSPVANAMGNALNDLKDMTKQTLVVASTFAVGGFTAQVLKGGVRGAQVAVRAATEAKGKLGGAQKGIAGTGVYQAVRASTQRIGWGALMLTVPYTAAMMISGIMAYMALVLFPLAATGLALGYSGLVRAVATLYLSGLLLGVASPLVFGASVQLMMHNSVRQIQQQVQQVMAQAEQIKQVNEANIARLRSEVETYAQEVISSSGQQEPQNVWQRVADWMGDRVSGAANAINNAFNALLTPLNNMLNALTTWLVSGLVSIALFIISTLAIIIGSAWTINRLAGAIRV